MKPSACARADAPAINVEKIEHAFEAAISNGLKWPKLRLDSFVFSPAPDSGKNAGSIYVKEDGEYLGKITNGKFYAVRTCDGERKDRVVKAAADPEASAVAYGKRTGECSCCGRTLTDPESVERGIGPICADKYGW
jgi:hypothetical protein